MMIITLNGLMNFYLSYALVCNVYKKLTNAYSIQIHIDGYTTMHIQVFYNVDNVNDNNNVFLYVWTLMHLLLKTHWCFQFVKSTNTYIAIETLTISFMEMLFS